MLSMPGNQQLTEVQEQTGSFRVKHSGEAKPWQWQRCRPPPIMSMYFLKLAMLMVSCSLDRDPL